ncbi:unnamed protein product [Rotaria sp. Silwood2]|nr:unnamed protein product [Rotaria sp. Silwood2]
MIGVRPFTAGHERSGNSSNQKRQDSFNINLNGIKDGFKRTDEDINRNTTVMHNQSTSTYSDTPRPSNNAQQVELLEHNGILYAPIEQENYLGHKKVYKHPYNEVPTSSTMNHPQLDHRRFNKSDNNTNSGYDSSLTTPDSCCHLQKKSISTPKRNRDQLNKSNEKRKKIRHEEVIHQQQQTKYQPNSNIPYQGKSLINKTTTGQTNTTTAHTNSIKPYSLPLDQLERAVGCNLPCFIIEFEKVTAARDLPSAIIACDLIQNHFKKNNIYINDFSVASFYNHRLKLGVNNMEDYSKLVLTELWTTSINNKKITLIKPKFVPECFSLVVRYVLKSISIQTITEEIKRSISSAENFKQIVYSFDRPTNDYRFTVANLMEYEGALKLGRLSIVNRLHPITKYLPTNKLTFCTYCWRLDHTYVSCSSKERKCKICLQAFDHDHVMNCSGKPICAQCGLDHHSLDPKCHHIQNYKQVLNREVKQAVSDGTINRGAIQLHRLHQSKPITVPLAHSASEYPTLTSNNSNNFQPLQNNNKIWPCNNLQITSNTSTDLTYGITTMMEKIQQELKHEMWAMKDTILNKLQDIFDAISSNIQLHQASLNSINSTITSVLNNVLLPMVNIISDQHQQAKEEIITALHYIEKTFRTQAEHLRVKFNIGSNTDRSITTNLTTSTINDNQQSPANDTPTLMEDSDSPLEKNQN